jgi:hypothetical protein
MKSGHMGIHALSTKKNQHEDKQVEQTNNDETNKDNS